MFRIRENEIADALTAADIWQIMLREVPPIAAEYFIGGADELTTLKANVLAFQLFVQLLTQQDTELTRSQWQLLAPGRHTRYMVCL